MLTLGLDIGSSSVKAAILRNRQIISPIARVAFATCFDGPRAEVNPRTLLNAITKCIAALGSRARRADVIALSVMCPAWVVMDRLGRPLTPIITHQDRRSVTQALQLEKRVGKSRHLRLAGNRPFPGGISSTTWLWLKRHHPGLLRKADLVGQLNTFLHRQITGARVIDPSNASFTGFYLTTQQGGWSRELCEAAELPVELLPPILPSNAVAGKVTPQAGRRLGLRSGTPMMTGIIDTSAAMLLTGAKSGQLVHVCGSTDVLALCTDRPKPHPMLLTRALGIGRKWISAATLAAAGSALQWAKDQFFADMSQQSFDQLVSRLAKSTRPKTAVSFEPYLAGERTEIQQRHAAFSGLSLGTTRQDMLWAIIDALAQHSAARLPILAHTGTRMLRQVLVSGGAYTTLAALFHRDWPGRWVFEEQGQATLRGLGVLGMAESGQ